MGIVKAKSLCAHLLVIVLLSTELLLAKLGITKNQETVSLFILEGQVLNVETFSFWHDFFNLFNVHFE